MWCRTMRRPRASRTSRRGDRRTKSRSWPSIDARAARPQLPHRRLSHPRRPTRQSLLTTRTTSQRNLVTRTHQHRPVPLRSRRQATRRPPMHRHRERRALHRDHKPAGPPRDALSRNRQLRPKRRRDPVRQARPASRPMGTMTANAYPRCFFRGGHPRPLPKPLQSSTHQGQVFAPETVSAGEVPVSGRA